MVEYCHVGAKHCQDCPLKCKKKGLQTFRPSTLLQCPPQSPPQGDQFPGNDVPGHATRLVATQQPDKALHFTTSLAGGLCGCQKLQAFNDKSCKLGQIILPHKLPHANVWTKELLIFLSQRTQRSAF